MSWSELMTSGPAAACAEEDMPDIAPEYERYSELAVDDAPGRTESPQ